MRRRNGPTRSTGCIRGLGYGPGRPIGNRRLCGNSRGWRYPSGSNLDLFSGPLDRFLLTSTGSMLQARTVRPICVAAMLRLTRSHGKAPRATRRYARRFFATLLRCSSPDVRVWATPTAPQLDQRRTVECAFTLTSETWSCDRYERPGRY